uniref:PH domain-containing protein n=1 Tax=Amphiprion percula TaxID=161767 RepID=A0A3P8SKN1_AMPPE
VPAPPCYHGDAAVTCQFRCGDAQPACYGSEYDGKVQTFGKRCQAAKRDPNCAVVIRGWLNKKKKRWFVLSNYCLFITKVGTQLYPSTLSGFPCAPTERICAGAASHSRATKSCSAHRMRSYFFSADTQEDMLGWVRALSQSAAMEPDSTMSRYNSVRYVHEVISSTFHHCTH